MLTPSAADNTQTVFDVVRPELDRVTETLTQLSASNDPLLGPMLATVLPGSGKRLRPALALLIGKLGAVDAVALNHMATGVELLHTASLVHDDVVDESETRRGSATLFTRVGNALAILVGDYLFSQAAQACVATGNLDVVRLFAETLGAMAQGQIDEANTHVTMSQPWRNVTRDRYFQTIRGKTASLFVLACQGSAILVGLPPSQVAALQTYGENLGLAFQVVDDILDFTSTETMLGKPVGSDLRQGTITLPVIQLRDSGSDSRRFDDVFESGDVDRQVELVQRSGAIEATYDEALRFRQRALDALEALPDGQERTALAELAVYVTQRET